MVTALNYLVAVKKSIKLMTDNCYPWRLNSLIAWWSIFPTRLYCIFK